MIASLQIAEILWIFIERADKILIKEWRFSKVSAKWGPRLVTPEQKRSRCALFKKDNHELFKDVQGNFLTLTLLLMKLWFISTNWKPKSPIFFGFVRFWLNLLSLNQA